MKVRGVLAKLRKLMDLQLVFLAKLRRLMGLQLAFDILSDGLTMYWPLKASASILVAWW